MRDSRIILVVEDDELEVFLLERAFAKAEVKSRVSFAQDGQEAIDYLSGDGKFADRSTHPIPHLILLDLRMPKVDGFDVLEWVREQPQFECTPVVVLTSSDEPQDVRKAYQLGANSYVRKGFGQYKHEELATLLYRYWTEINLSPAVPA